MTRLVKPWLVAGMVALAAVMPYLATPLANYRILSLSQFQRLFWDPFRGRPGVRIWEPLTTLDAGPGSIRGQDPAPSAPEPAITLQSKGSEPAGPLLEDPSNSLRSFHEALARSGQKVVRISHFGDSPITGDLISGEARARFQKRYGNAGHGWILPGRPWEWYGHLGVSLEDEGWIIQSPAATCRRDRAYGFGGVSFSSLGGASTQVTTAKQAPFNRLEVHYLAQPEGGTLSIRVDGEASSFSTQRAETGPAVETLRLAEDAPHSISLRAKGEGEVILYGLALERDAPGVVYDALGANGGAIRHLTLQDETNWIAALKLRKPDLVILAYGTNEAGYANIPGPGYEQDYRKVIARIRKALPGVSILIMAPMDRAERNPDGAIVTMPAIPRIVAAQRKLALETGCAFFNTFQAMGGEGSALRWYKVSPRLMAGDFTHPSRGGADRVAGALVEALSGKVLASAGSELQRPEGKP